MSLFICNLSYKDSTIINEAKFGVLIGSTIAAILALVVIKTLARKEHKTENVKE
jgi:Na+/H+ antiporter NhaA